MQKNNVLSEIAASKKYAQIDDGTLLHIEEQESKKYKKQSEVVKAVKNKLHAVHEIFLPAKNLQFIEGLVQQTCKENAKQTAETLLKQHVSTQERVFIYQDFLHKLFGAIRDILQKDTIESCIDIGAGFNGLALFAYGYLEKIKSYTALDIHKKMTDLLNDFFKSSGCKNAWTKTQGFFDKSFTVDSEVCFMLKLLPVLIAQDTGKIPDILQNIFAKIHAKVVVISFPTKSVSGKNVGMRQNYQTQMIEHLPKFLQLIHTFDFANEVCYIFKNTNA